MKARKLPCSFEQALSVCTKIETLTSLLYRWYEGSERELILLVLASDVNLKIFRHAGGP